MRSKEEKERRKLNRKLMKRTFISEIKEPKFQKFANEYMGIGMCLGVSLGLIYGNLIFSDSAGVGMCFGISIGMSLGLAIGQAKDKRLLENAMEINRIEHLAGYAEIFIYAVDKSGVEKEYRVSEKKMKAEKFKTGDKVAEEREGVLISLESKQEKNSKAKE